MRMPIDPVYRKLPKETRQEIDREVKAEMEKEMAKEKAFFKAHPLRAAYWILPGIGSIVSLSGSGERTMKQMLGELRRMPCPSWALREAVEDTRRLVSTKPAPPSSDTSACQAWRMMQALSRIPDEFWEPLYAGLPHKKKPGSKTP